MAKPKEAERRPSQIDQRVGFCENPDQFIWLSGLMARIGQVLLFATAVAAKNQRFARILVTAFIRRDRCVIEHRRRKSMRHRVRTKLNQQKKKKRRRKNASPQCSTR